MFWCPISSTHMLRASIERLMPRRMAMPSPICACIIEFPPEWDAELPGLEPQPAGEDAGDWQALCDIGAT